MTDLHAMAEEAAQEIQAPTFGDVDYVAIIERALAKLQAEHEAEQVSVVVKANSRTSDVVFTPNTAIVAKALERAAMALRRYGNHDLFCVHSTDIKQPCPCGLHSALSPDADEKVLVPREAGACHAMRAVEGRIQRTQQVQMVLALRKVTRRP